jgi:hypothetical protein
LINGEGHALKASFDSRVSAPYRMFVVLENTRKLLQIFVIKHDPLGPDPRLMWASYLQIKNDPMKAIRGN